MANDNDPRLYPLNRRPISANYYRVSTSTDIFIGCPVLLDSDGYVKASSATGAVPVLGVALGFAGTLKRGLATADPYLDVSDLTPPSPSSDTGDRWVLVADDPQQLFVIQEDTGATALTLADAGSWCDFIYRGATATAVTGNTDTGWATVELDVSGIVTTTAAPLRVLRLHDYVNTDGTENAAGDFGKWVVQIGHHQRSGVELNVPV